MLVFSTLRHGPATTKQLYYVRGTNYNCRSNYYTFMTMRAPTTL